MSKHTQGKMVVTDTCSNYVFNVVRLGNMDTNFGSEEDARRLAACWNYFDSSIGTDFIESDSFSTMQESFIRQRAEIQKLNANLSYYQKAMYYKDVPLYQVEHGGVVPEVTAIRVGAIVEELDAARALLNEVVNMSQSGPNLGRRISAYLDAGNTLGNKV